MMSLFSAPDREASCVKRDRASTPLQSLGLFNETQRIEIGRSLARRLIQASKGDGERIDELFRLLACRAPTPAKQSAVSTLLATMKERYANAEPDALALLKTGEAGQAEGLSMAEHAAWTQVPVTVLASDIALLLY